MARLHVVIVSCVYLAVSTLSNNNPKHGTRQGLERCSSFSQESGYSHHGIMLDEPGHGCGNVKFTTSRRTKNSCVSYMLLLIVVFGILQLYFSTRHQNNTLKYVDGNMDHGHCYDYIISMFKSVKHRRCAPKRKMGMICERNELKRSLSDIDEHKPSKKQFFKRTVEKYFDSLSEKIDKVLSGLFQIQPEYLSVPEMVAQPFTTLTTFLGKVQEMGQMPVEEEMCYEVRRLQSFSGVPVQASPMRLAQSGFYATGHEDEARCFSCGKSHLGWQIMDRPDVLHRAISPDCQHLNRCDPRNIPLTSNSNATTVYGVLGEYSRSSNGAMSTDTLPPTTTEIPTLGGGGGATAAAATPTVSGSSLDMNSAVYPYYKDMQTRLDSFRTWDMSHVQNPRLLAAAGFFYAGYSDCVRCFYCGVGLKTWEERDDPFVEHVRWRSSCSYIRRLKGENFVIQALAHKTSPSCTVTNNVAVVERAVEMGFSRQMVERALTEMSRSYTNPLAADQIPVSLEMLLERLVFVSEQPDETHRSPESPHGRHQVSEVPQSLPPRLTTSSNSTTANRPSSVNPPSSSTRHSDGTTSGRSISGTETSRSMSPSMSPSLQRQLEEENRALRDETTCKVCLDRTSNIVFLPCGHLVTCAECAPALSKCPICRAHIRGTVRSYNA